MTVTQAILDEFYRPAPITETTLIELGDRATACVVVENLTRGEQRRLHVHERLVLAWSKT